MKLIKEETFPYEYLVLGCFIIGKVINKKQHDSFFYKNGKVELIRKYRYIDKNYKYYL